MCVCVLAYRWQEQQIAKNACAVVAFCVLGVVEYPFSHMRPQAFFFRARVSTYVSKWKFLHLTSLYF